jgi:hypothetical protein
MFLVLETRNSVPEGIQKGNVESWEEILLQKKVCPEILTFIPTNYKDN